MVTKKKAKQTTEPKPLKLRLSIKAQIEGEEGMRDFGRLLRVLYDNGYQGTVRTLLNELVTVADKKGVIVPPDIRAIVERANAKLPN